MSHADPDARLKALLAPGNLFESKYRIVSKLGTGSFAIVVKARHEVMGRDVALKFLKPSVVRSNPEVSDRFVNEVQIVSRLRHPNTVTIFDFGQTRNGLAYMVLEYLEGATLDERIDEQGAFDEQRALRVCRQILKSLSEAHAAGIVHRDLKPSNIMLTQMHGEPDFVKVLDFGVAKLLEESDAGDGKLEPRSTQFIGTPVYMSPEQVLGQPVTPASDLYSLGLILYEMLTGESPIAHENVASVVREHLDDAPLPFPALDQMSEPLQKLIRKATARQPGARFGSVREFARALPTGDRGAAAERHALGSAARAPEPAQTLAEESSEADVFSGKNYIEHPELEAGGRTQRRREPPRRPQRQSRPEREQRTRTKTNRPKPSPSTDQLDLDLDSIDRQRRRIEQRRRRESASARQVDGGWEASEYWARLGAVGLGLFAGYWAFVLLGAMLVEQPDPARFGAGVLMVVAAVAWAGFSSVQAVGVGFARRWVIPSARNLVYIALIVVLGAAFWQPGSTASALNEQPTWFFSVLPDIPPFTWLEAITDAGAKLLASFFAFMAKVLPY